MDAAVTHVNEACHLHLLLRLPLSPRLSFSTYFVSVPRITPRLPHSRFPFTHVSRSKDGTSSRVPAAFNFISRLVPALPPFSSSTTATAVAKRWMADSIGEKAYSGQSTPQLHPFVMLERGSPRLEDADRVWWERVARTPRNHRRAPILECRPANSDWYEDVRRLIDNTLVNIAAMFASRNGKRKRSRECLSICRVGRRLPFGITERLTLSFIWKKIDWARIYYRVESYSILSCI